MDDLEQSLAGLDTPVALPEAVRARLEAALLDPLAGLDAPVPLPLPVQERLVAVLTSGSVSPVRRAAGYWLTAAAAAVLVAAALTAVTLSGGQTKRSVAVGPSPAVSSPSTTSVRAATFPGGAALSTNGGAGGLQSTSAAPVTTSGPAAGGAGAGVPAAATVGPAPPYAFGPSNEAAAMSSAPSAAGSASPATTVPPPAPLRLGIVRGDPAEEAGFNAYLHLLDGNGGAGGHQVSTVEITPGTAAAGTIATVNLSGTPLASANAPPSWASGPLLETLLVPDAVLHGRVYDFSSSAERQAHLVANALFPSSSPGATAVIYRAPSGVLSDVVPAALQQVLRARGVTSTVVTYQPGQPVTALGQAAFLSLSPTVAHGWLQEASRVTFPKGVAGVGDLLDPSLLALLPAGSEVMSPYALPTGDEAAALSAAVGGPINAAELHGWITAKTLSVAIWRTGAATAVALQSALDGLGGYTDTLRPPYQLRPGTNSRTPEGLLYTNRGGQFVAVGSFRRDPF